MSFLSGWTPIHTDKLNKKISNLRQIKNLEIIIKVTLLVSLSSSYFLCLCVSYLVLSTQKQVLYQPLGHIAKKTERLSLVLIKASQSSKLTSSPQLFFVNLKRVKDVFPATKAEGANFLPVALFSFFTDIFCAVLRFRGEAKKK